MLIHLKLMIVILLITILLPGMVPAAMADSKQLDLGGQYITGHKISRWLGNMDEMIFTVAKKVPGENTTWAFVCDELANGQVPNHVSFYFHGDNEESWVEKNPIGIISNAKKIRSDTCWVIPYRPHSRTNKTWRSRDEMRYHLAVVDYVINTLGVDEFDVHGFSGGGTVAVMVLQERRRHVRFAGLASPVLAVKARTPSVNNGLVYDPYYHIEKLLARTPEIPELCLLVVWDPKDRVVNKNGVLPYITRAKELGLGEDRVRLVQVIAYDQEKRHNSDLNLGQEMLQLKRSGDFCL